MSADSKGQSRLVRMHCRTVAFLYKVTTDSIPATCNLVAKQPALKIKLNLPMNIAFKEASGEQIENFMVVLCET